LKENLVPPKDEPPFLDEGGEDLLQQSGKETPIKETRKRPIENNHRNNPHPVRKTPGQRKEKLTRVQKAQAIEAFGGKAHF